MTASDRIHMQSCLLMLMMIKLNARSHGFDHAGAPPLADMLVEAFPLDGQHPKP